MLAIATVLVALILSLVITKIATVALSVTGLSRESARFQARSAFTGVGFTTREAERVVNHPVRRRIVLTLMLLGNAGLVTIVASLLISFSAADDGTQAWQRIALLFVGLIAVFFLATNRYVDRAMSRVITFLLHRYTDLDVRDFAELLQLTGGYGVIELEIEPEHWTVGRKLEELRLRSEGIAVLGIQRPNGEYTGVPNGASVVHAGDVLVLYGRTAELAKFGARTAGPEGDAEHRIAAERHEAIEAVRP